MGWLKELVPMIGTALGGPLGGVAASFIADALGLSDKTVESVTNVLTNNKLSPDQVAQLKVAEVEFQKFCKQNNLDLERVHQADRDSARQMQAAVRSRIPGCLAILVTLGFFGILLGMMLGKLNVSDQQALLILLGALSTAFGSVLNFYFGSSNGSQTKDVLLANSSPVK